MRTRAPRAFRAEASSSIAARESARTPGWNGTVEARHRARGSGPERRGSPARRQHWSDSRSRRRRTRDRRSQRVRTPAAARRRPSVPARPSPVERLEHRRRLACPTAARPRRPAGVRRTARCLAGTPDGSRGCRSLSVGTTRSTALRTQLAGHCAAAELQVERMVRQSPLPNSPPKSARAIAHRKRQPTRSDGARQAAARQRASRRRSLPAEVPTK